VSSWLQTRCRRALASPRAPWHRACHPTGKGSGIATCPVAPDPPPGEGGLWRHHVLPGTPPDREVLWCHHASRGSRPTSRCGRALASPCSTGPPPGREGLRCCHVFHSFRSASQCVRAPTSPSAPCRRAHHPQERAPVSSRVL
jgi:hypothetical protein